MRKALIEINSEKKINLNNLCNAMHDCIEGLEINDKINLYVFDADDLNKIETEIENFIFNLTDSKYRSEVLLGENPAYVITRIK